MPSGNWAKAGLRRHEPAVRPIPADLRNYRESRADPPAPNNGGTELRTRGLLITDTRPLYSYLAPPLLGAGGTVNWGDGEIVATQSLRYNKRI